MARSSLCITSLLLLSLVIFASAHYDIKPNKLKTPTKQQYGKPKPDEKIKSTPTKPNYAQPEGIKKKTNNYAPSKPVYHDQKPKEIPTKSNYKGASPVPQQENKSTLPITTIAVQGLVLCKQGLKYFPIQGAVAKIICIAECEEGYKTKTLSILSGASDAKGYFYATLLSPSTLIGDHINNIWNLKECKAYLDHSPLESCNIPTNVNDGIHGHLLSSYNVLKHTSTKLFSVGPFYYSTSSYQPKSPSSPTPAY
ncbi:hypothetical protein CsatA_027568 [Cannabis sativa]